MGIQQSKEDAAREEMRKQAKSIQDRKMVAMRQSFANQNGIGGPEFGGGAGSSSGMAGFGGGGYDGGSNGFDNGQSNYASQQYQSYNAPAPAAPEPPRVVAKGMKL